MRPTLVLLAILLLVAPYLLPPPAHAAQSYDSCTGYIDSLPAVIGSQGTWCLRKDLSTAMASGSAITIDANNVTIDCNDFKIGGLAAGSGSLVSGIHSGYQQNVTVRNCNVRGFLVGISLSGTGHLIEDNRLDGQLSYGITADGANSTVRRNRVLDIGGYSGNAYGVGIHTAGSVTDNTVAGISTSGSGNAAYGILLVGGPGSVARGNTVRALYAPGEASRAYGIYSNRSGARVEHNDLAGASATQARPFFTPNDALFCGHNTVSGFNVAPACIDIGGNNVF